MKILALSDIHSNIYALDAIWDKEKDADLIVAAGDLVDYGPFPKKDIPENIRMAEADLKD